LILELLVSAIINTKGIHVNLNNYNLDNSDTGTYNFDIGDSNDTLERIQRETLERDRLTRERLDRLGRGSGREVTPRDRNATESRGESYSGTGGEVTIIGKDTQYFNCVSYAKARSGIGGSIGNGGRKGINTQVPQVGAIGVEKSRYHATYIEQITGETVTISEANYYKGLITRRVLKRSDFIGFVI
jgi:hypothetical protein